LIIQYQNIPQWRTLSSGCDRKSNADNNCNANLRVKLSDTPRKFVLRNKSYKLYDNNSNTRHKWLRNVKCRFNLTLKTKRRFFNYFLFFWLNTYRCNHYYQYHVGSLIQEDVLQFELEKEMVVYFWLFLPQHILHQYDQRL
jgi:hypothetical protein